jgi:hypothetical protein
VNTPQGSVCLLPNESDCQSTNGLCNAGLVCASDQRCRVACVGAADCLASQLCAQGVCADSTNVDGNGALKSGAGVGAACTMNTDCNSPLSCVMGTCHYTCTGTNACPMNQTCIKVLGLSVCQLPVESGCNSATGSPCPSGLVCASDNRCHTACRFGSDCTPGQVCTSGVCADPSDMTNGQLNPKDPPKLDAGAPTPDAAKDRFVGNLDTNWTIPIGGFGGTASTGGTGGAADAGADAIQADTPVTGGTPSLDAGGTGGSTGRDGAVPDLKSANPDVARSPDTLTPDAPIKVTDDGGGRSTVLTGCGVSASTPRYFCDDFESGLSNWVVSGQDWATTAAQARSGGNSATESPNGDIASGEKAAMTMVASLDLTNAVDPILVFWDKRSAYYNTTCVEASSDGGSTWSQLISWLGSTGAYNDHSTWLMQQASLASFVGKKLKVRFRLDQTNTSTAYDGWYIDDVEIRENWPVDVSGTGATGCGAMPAPISARYFCDDFESGLSKWIVSGHDWNTTTAQTRSGSVSITETPDGQIITDENAAATMARSIDLTGAAAPVLVFWDKRFANYNTTYVEASPDGGSTWSQLISWTGSTGASSDHSTWLMQQVPLTSFVGKKLKIRFRLDQANTSTAYDGWYIDDVEIREAN